MLEGITKKVAAAVRFQKWGMAGYGTYQILVRLESRDVLG